MRVLLFVGCVALAATVANGDARLVNFESKGRVPGSFVVVFKTQAELAAVPVDGPGSPAISPKVFPVSRNSTAALAEAISKSIGAHVTRVIYLDGGTAEFSISGATDENIRKILAKDPRIAEIIAIQTVTDNRK